MKLLLSILCASLLVASCHSKKIIESKPDPVPNDIELTVDEPRDSTSVLSITIGSNEVLTGFSDPYKILNAEVKGNELWLELSYGGGCREHEFKLVFNGTPVKRKDQETNISGLVSLNLGHNGNQDACRSIVRQNLRFDLKSLQSKDFKHLIIRLKNWENELVYSY